MVLEVLQWGKKRRGGGAGDSIRLSGGPAFPDVTPATRRSPLSDDRGRTNYLQPGLSSVRLGFGYRLFVVVSKTTTKPRNAFRVRFLNQDAQLIFWTLAVGLASRRVPLL